MSEPFLGEIRMVGFTFAHRGWAFCDGQVLPINQNQSLYSLLGTTFGGDGRTSFALPDLRGRVPVHAGPGFVLGQRGGASTHTLATAELPSHTHAMQAHDGIVGNNVIPTGNMLAQSAPNEVFHYAPPGVPAEQPNTIATTGGGQAHDNMQPFLGLHFVIALQGLFPSRN